MIFQDDCLVLRNGRIPEITINREINGIPNLNSKDSYCEKINNEAVSRTANKRSAFLRNSAISTKVSRLSSIKQCSWVLQS